MAIAALALIIRLVFALDAVIGGGMVFSGSGASYHHKIITAILESGTFLTSDSALNYPLGSVNPNPPLFDIMAAVPAKIATLFGMSTSSAVAYSLSFSSPVFGTLSCVAVYFLGKEVLGKKSAGMLAALFLALCPALITQSVLSNGTEVSFIVFVSILMALFAFRAVSKMPHDSDDIGLFKAVIGTKGVLLNAMLAGMMFLVIMMSWGGFRPLLIMGIFLMAIAVLADRFFDRDPRASALVFTIMLALPVAIAIPVYVMTDLWEPIMFGNAMLLFICVGLCFGFAVLRKLPWTLTIPVISAVAAVIFVYLGFFADGLLSTIYHGGSLADLSGATNRIRLSTLAVLFGWATLWFGWAFVALRMYKFPSNKESRVYLFTIFWTVALLVLSWDNAALAAIASPAYAVGFGATMIWLFEFAGISDYYQSLKGNDIKTIWRKVIKPLPFGTVLCVVLLIAAPNAIYAVDSGISHAGKSDYNEKYSFFGNELFGSSGYYIEGKDARERSDVFRSFWGMPKTGALVTGQSNVTDVSDGGFGSVSDSHGGGMVAASQILLSNGSNGEAVAAMMYRIISSKGGIAAFEAELKAGELSDQDYNKILEMDNNPGKARTEILQNMEKYGKFRSDISDENVRYVYFKNAMVDNLDSHKISLLYDAVCTKAGAKITYVAVSGDMLPLSMESQIVVNMYVAGYAVDSTSSSEFINVFQYGQQKYFNGTKAAFADTLLWKAFIGVMPTADRDINKILNGIGAGDGSLNPSPGAGLTGFKLHENKWMVKYNSDKDAKYDSDGWVVLPAAKAQQKQRDEGGVIGYISALPVVFEYISSTGSVSGTVTFGADNVSGIEVSLIDAKGKVMAIAHTGSDGKYSLPTIGGEAEVRFRAGAVDGKGITLATLGVAPTVDYAIPNTSFAGKITVPGDAEKLVFTGNASGKKYFADINASGEFSVASIVPDVYDVDFVRASKVIKTVKLTVYPGDTTGYELESGAKSKITVTDEITGKPLQNVEVTVNGITDPSFTDAKTTAVDGDGTVEFELPGGLQPEKDKVEYHYIAQITGAGYYGTATFKAGENPTINAFHATDSPTALDADTNYVLFSGTTAMAVKDSIKLPTGPLGPGKFTLYATKGNQAAMAVNDAAGAFALTMAASHKVSGKLMDGDKAVTGTIGFVNSEGAAVFTSATTEKYEIALPNGTYTVYAFKDSSKAVIGEVKVNNAAVTKDFTLGEARKVSGTVSVIGIRKAHVGVEVSVGAWKLNLLTNSTGNYSMVLPKDVAATSIVAPADPAKFVPTKTDSNKSSVTATGSSFSDEISFNMKVSVTNNTGHALKIGDVELPDNALKDVTFKSKSATDSWFLNATSGVKAKWADGTVIDPYVASPLNFAPGDAIVLYGMTVNGAGDAPTFTVKPLDEEAGKYEVDKTDKKILFLEGGKAFLVTIENAGKIEILNKNLGALESITPDMKDALTVKTYVGTVKDGSGGTLKESKVWYDYGTIELEFTKSDGIYERKIPYAANVKVSAEFEYEFKDEGIGRLYKTDRTVAVPADTKNVTINLSLAYDSDTAIAVDGENITVEDMDILTHVKDNIRESRLTFSFNVKTTEAALRTLALSGSNWTSLRFFSDAGHANEISAVSDPGASATVYAIGIFDGGKYSAGDLGVSVKGLDDKEVAKATFPLDDAQWSNTEVNKEGTTKAGNAVDVASEYEYYHSVKLVNDSNYAKTFNVKATFQNPDGKWLAVFVSDGGEMLSPVDLAAGNNVTVPGYKTLEVFVKFTSADGSKDSAAPVTDFEVTCAGEKIGTIDGDEGATLDGDKIKFKSKPGGLDLEVQDPNASGRGVHNSLGKIPNTVWIMLAIILVLILVTVWMGMKRGVFSRGK